MELDVLIVILGAAGTCALGGVFPWISAEVVILGAALAVPPATSTLLAVACAAGQMMGKTAIYGIMRWTPDRLPDRLRRFLSRAEALGERPRILAGSVLTGAAFGLPPLYVVTLAAGLARLSLALFVVAGFLGTLIRYGIILWGAGLAGWAGGS